MIEESKITLARMRAELVEKLATLLPNQDRVRIQGELSLVNAKIKALNTTEAAQQKAAADRRKVAGLAEAQANAARAQAKVTTNSDDQGNEDDDDPAQTAAIDGWIDALLLRHDVDFSRARGKLVLDVAPKWATVFRLLIDGIYAASRGQELPALPRPRPQPSNPLNSEKPKKR